MRIGLLIYGSLETLSGGYLYDRKLVEHLQRQGDQVEIVSLPWRDYLRHLGDNFSPALLRRLARLEVDLLLQDELNHPSLFLLNQRLQRQASYPLVAIVHHLRSSEARPAWQNCFYRWVERRYLASVDGFIFNSRTTQQVVTGLVGANRPSIVAYPAGDRFNPAITAEQIAARARQPGPLRLLFLGNLIPRKGLHTLLEALNRLPSRAWRLLVAGSQEMDRAYAAALHARVRAKGLEEQVCFLGPIHEARLLELLGSSHIMVVPSSYEGFGIAYLEGMGFGLPAVATTAGAAHEIITPGRDGYLVPPGNVRALSEILGQLVNDRERLVALSLAAQQRFGAHPTWEHTGAQVRAFLHEIKTP